jgi:hypothetical protein
VVRAERKVDGYAAVAAGKALDHELPERVAHKQSVDEHEDRALALLVDSHGSLGQFELVLHGASYSY